MGVCQRRERPRLQNGEDDDESDDQQKDDVVTQHAVQRIPERRSFAAWAPAAGRRSARVAVSDGWSAVSGEPPSRERSKANLLCVQVCADELPRDLAVTDDHHAAAVARELLGLAERIRMIAPD